MAVSMRDLDPTFQGIGLKAGIEIWRIENFHPVPIPSSSHGKFFTGDSYVILKTTATKSGALRHDIHYWLGKDTSQDEAGTAAIKTVELDAALGGRAVQYREVQGHETEKFLSYFKPCIIPQEGGVASGFKHAEAKEYQTRLFVCTGKHAVHVKEVPFVRSSLNHDDIFILDTKLKIFQFNGSTSCIPERAKALEVVQYIKDTYHGGKCDVAAIEDGKMMADSETGEFWAFFGGFAPLPRKTATIDDKITVLPHLQLFRVENGKAEAIDSSSLVRDLLDTNKCYILDCGMEVFLWMGRNTSLDERKKASIVVEELVRSADRPSSHIVSVIEGFETVSFRSKFDSWPLIVDVVVSEDGRGKVAELLKRQGVDVKGLLKASPVKQDPEPYIDITGKLQVWRVSGREKVLLSASEQSKFYNGDCYVFQYSYPVDDRDDYLIGTWFGKKSIVAEREAAISMASNMVQALKFLPAQARIYEGYEPIQFFSIFQSFIVFEGGKSISYQNYLSENGLPDKSYKEDGVALFRVQGSGPDNMQAIQVEPVASSLNSSYCYILHNDSSVYTWTGNFTNVEDQELVERFLDLIKPHSQSKLQKEGTETEQFWSILGGRSEYYPTKKHGRDSESDPHLFCCAFSKGDLKVTEIHNFSQDDLLTEDLFILDCHSDIYVWVGQQVDSQTKLQALAIAEAFVAKDFLLENLSHETPICVVMEESEPPFFTRFFSWDSARYNIPGNSFQRKLAIVKGGGPSVLEKPKRRAPVSHGGGGRSASQEKSQRSRSMSFSPDRVRVRGRSPAFNALAANFENPSARNLSTPPPAVRKVYPKSITPDAMKLASKSANIVALSSSFEQPIRARQFIFPPSGKVSPITPKSAPEIRSKDNMELKFASLAIEEAVKEEVPNEEGPIVHPLERLQTNTSNPVNDIDVTKREAYLSLQEFREKFGMPKAEFYKLPRWKQNKLKMALHLF